MPIYHQERSFNPFIHGTSSETLSMMQHTDFQLMPILAMLEDFKIAPMVGELTQGGFGIIGEGLNRDTFAGAPAFGRVQNEHYDLDKVIKSYTQHANSTNLNTCKENLQDSLKRCHQSAFTRLNLLMIYLARVRQLGVKISDVVSLDEINTLKERLDASVHFYYFILCIQKYIFIDGAEMQRFKEENNLEGPYAVGDYLEHFFSFENFLEKLRIKQCNITEIYQCNITEIYHATTPENINKLIEFTKIPKDSQENIKRYPSGKEHFRAVRDYHFFTSQEQGYEIHYHEIGRYLFSNVPNYSLPHYLERHYQSYTCREEKENVLLSLFPNFKEFHPQVLSHIEALNNRIQLCNTLLDAPDNEFVHYPQKDKLITHPFPVVFITETPKLERYHDEYRSRVPLKLGKEIVLVATDNKNHLNRVRDYLQKNNVGPVEVLLFDDLYTLRSSPYAHSFDALANDDLIKAFELAKKQNCAAEFSKLYRALAELNEKRYRFKSINEKMVEKLTQLLTDVLHDVLTPDKNRINFIGIQEVLQHNQQENNTLYASHRGVLGVIDTLLTILASLVVFYPITYLVQKRKHLAHTFFATDTERKVNSALLAAEEIRHKTAGLADQLGAP